MYNVSLLPYQYKELYKHARKKDYTFLLIIVIMCVLILAYFILSVISAGKDSMLKNFKESNSMLEQQISSLKSVDELNKKVSSLSDKVQKATGNTPDWANLIAEIGNTVKPNTTINSIRMSYIEKTKNTNDSSGNAKDSKKNEGIIECEVYDIYTLAEWLKELKGISDIEEIKCSIIDETKLQNSKSIPVEIKFKLLPGTEKQSQEVTDR